MARTVTAYIAASWSRRFYLRTIRATLRDLSVRVRSPWIDDDHDYEDGDFVREAHREQYAIRTCDFLVLDTTDMNSRGGRDWEAGYAAGLGKRVIRVGPIRTPLHAVTQLGFETWDAFFSHLRTAKEHADARNN